MEQNSQARENLISQIENSYGKLLYTYTCHLKQAHIYARANNVLTWSDIILTAITTGSLLGLLFTDAKVLAIVSAICAALSLGINLYTKESKFAEKSIEHQRFAQSLWLSREQYISLLVDAPLADINDIQSKRDELTNTVNALYASEPLTSGIAYHLARKAIKQNEEQQFSRDELNQMLPNNLRRD